MVPLRIDQTDNFLQTACAVILFLLGRLAFLTKYEECDSPSSTTIRLRRSIRCQGCCPCVRVCVSVRSRGALYAAPDVEVGVAPAVSTVRLVAPPRTRRRSLRCHCCCYRRRRCCCSTPSNTFAAATSILNLAISSQRLLGGSNSTSPITMRMSWTNPGRIQPLDVQGFCLTFIIMRTDQARNRSEGVVRCA